MKASISGWGRYRPMEVEVVEPTTPSACKQALLTKRAKDRLIARGLGRSYGDSSLADCVLATGRLHHFHHFDEQNGILTCAAGVTLSDILRVFVPRGWFLSVTPGTKFVSVGGAIASDVHGKNHHRDGTFGRHVRWLELLLGDGEIIRCSPSEHSDLFRATCGGMGLTGVILSAALQLRPIRSSDVNQTTLKAPGLDALLDLFERHKDATYSVAWIDCSATGKRLGRSLLMLGEHADHGELRASAEKRQAVPLDLLSAGLNSYSVKAFNALYFHRMLKKRSETRLHYDPYFYPLDMLHEWNRLYGKSGFLQYQFVVPKGAGRTGLKDVVGRIAASGKGSFLAVLKVLGAANDNPLSFPIEGYTLALDFKYQSGVLELLDELDRRIVDAGGRVYLAKDARMSEGTFKKTYPTWEQFEELRERYDAQHTFASRQSQRIGLI